MTFRSQFIVDIHLRDEDLIFFPSCEGEESGTFFEAPSRKLPKDATGDEIGVMVLESAERVLTHATEPTAKTSERVRTLEQANQNASIRNVTSCTVFHKEDSDSVVIYADRRAADGIVSGRSVAAPITDPRSIGEAVTKCLGLGVPR